MQLWYAYPEVVEGEVCQTHSSDVFGQLLQHLRVLCLNNKGKKNFHFAFHWGIFSMCLVERREGSLKSSGTAMEKLYTDAKFI